MLVQLTIENFRSFKELSTFSMISDSSDKQGSDNLIVDPTSSNKKRSLLPVSVIYGANAAGKSNLIEAISFARNLIVSGTKGTQNLSLPSFKLAPDSKNTSRFEFIFICDKTRYSYGFELSHSRVIEEWLYGKPPENKRDILFFERCATDGSDPNIKLGPVLRGKSAKRKQFLEFVAQGTRPNQLFLTESIDRNVSELLSVFNWFKESLVIIPAESNYAGLELGVLSNQVFTQFVQSLLKSSGTGIESVVAEEIDVDLEKMFPGMPKDFYDEILQDLEDKSLEEDAITFLRIYGENQIILKKEKGNSQLRSVKLKTQHLNSHGNLVSFDLEEESEGTQRLINLIPVLFLLSQDSEKVIFLDELDRRLHTLLSMFFLKSALSCTGSKNTNQLIFTTHDTHLLDLSVLRRDEVWFVEKTRVGESSLYSLAEFNVRPDLKIEKGYLNGRFGAIPFFGNLEDLSWCEQPVEV